MTLRNHLLFWLGAAVLVASALYALGGVLTPFVAGLALAYLLDPLVRRIERMGASRAVATSVVALAFALVAAILLIVLVPYLVRELVEFIAKLPDIAARLQSLVSAEILPRLEKLGVNASRLRPAEGQGGELARQAAGWMGTVLAGLWTGGQAIAGIVGLVAITPIVAFFLLLDWRAMIETIDSWLPRRHAGEVRAIAGQIDRAIAGFLRGQATVSLLLGVFYAIALTLCGLNFGFLIGLMSGLLGFIPYLGTLVGFAVSTGVAVAQFWPDVWMIGLVVGIFVVGQFVEGNFLQPKLVGDAVGLHPVWMIFALFAFGSLFGFVGLLVAVPVAASVGVLARYGLRLYLGSRYYDGDPPAAAGPPDTLQPTPGQTLPPAALVPTTARPSADAR